MRPLTSQPQRGPIDAFRAREGASSDDLKPPEFSDEALALRFAEVHGADLRYVAAWGQWLEWDGTLWKRDETLKAFDYARHICRAASAECSKLKLANQIARAQTVAAVERLARADRRIAATVDQWDVDAWLLNTREGVIDLQSGRLRPARRDDYMTKCTAIAPDDAEPTAFLAFLARITGEDFALQQFLQRLFGYCLTGVTREHALAFFHGTGGNGKSVLLSVATGIFGDYAKAAPIELFMVSRSEQHPTGLAGLRGARLVTAIETEEGRRWAENKIKALTGGDKIPARFMRQDFFEFIPQFKLVIAGNHKPGLRGVDEAIRRRMNLVPFIVTIPVEERDEQLSEKLKAEWPAILRWMINGCLEWQGEGLAQPEAVRNATEAYLEAEDNIAMWLQDCAEAGGIFGWLSSAALWRSWKQWADTAGEYPGSQKRLSETLKDRGFAFKRQGGTGRAGFEGIRLKCPITDGA
jgi:putative DNA primase/helicase